MTLVNTCHSEIEAIVRKPPSSALIAALYWVAQIYSNTRLWVRRVTDYADVGGSLEVIKR